MLLDLIYLVPFGVALIFWFLWAERGQTIKRLTGINKRLTEDSSVLETALSEHREIAYYKELRLRQALEKKKGAGRKPTRRKRK
jgi:hypothetical protein